MKISLILLVCGLIQHTKQDEICYLPSKAPNLAEYSEVCQSSFASGATHPGVDGTTKTNNTLFSCSVTNLEYMPYYRVDLGLSYLIGNVVIYNWQECCWDWLEGAQIQVGEEPSNNNPVCAIIGNCSKSQPRMVFDCKGMQGRYINIVHYKRSGFIIVCALEAYEHIV